MFLGTLFFVMGVFVMILAHEAGHFIAARSFGIKVEEFFIGFGPRLWSFRRGETEYGVKLLPLGGYVRIAGMNPFQEPAPEDRDRVFTAKPKGQRAVVLMAGSATHFVLAFLILCSLFWFVGIPAGGAPVVGSVEPTLDGRPSPASEAGLREGDLVLEVNGLQLRNVAQLGDYIAEHPGEPLELLVWRDGRAVEIRATPIETTLEGMEQGRLGISIEAQRRHLGPIDGALRSGSEIGRLVVGSFSAMGQVFGPEGLSRIGQLLSGDVDRSVRDPVGIVGAARVSGQALQAGFLDVLLYMFAFFNVFVGILNILPLPPLDGGHLAVLGFEALTGRRVDPRKLIPITALVAGFLILFTFSLLYLDVVSPIPNPFG